MYMFKIIFVTAVLLKNLSAQELYEKVEAVVGHDVKLPCNVTAETNGDELKVLAWYRNGSSTAFYSSDQRKDSVAYPSPVRYSLIPDDDEDGITKLVIQRVRPSDAGLYHCVADFSSSPSLKTFVMLNIIVPPQRMWVIFENGSHVATTSAGTNNSKDIGPYHVGDRVRLFCVVFKGNPQPSISWWDEQRQLKDTFTPLSAQRVRSDLDYGPLRREDHGKVLTCNSSNNDEAPSLAISIVIDMYLPPELVSVRVGEGDAVGRVTAGQSLTFQCRVLGARPQPTVKWRLGGAVLKNIPQNITAELTQRLLVSEVELCIRKEYDESLLTCCVPSYSRIPEEYVCAPGVPLTVLYPPSLKIEAEGYIFNDTLSVIKGSSVTLNCTHQANPPVYQMIWFHGDDIYGTTEGEQEAIIQPTVELKSVTEENGGEYACAATNDVGSLYSQPIVIDVTYPAYCEDETVSEYGIGEGESINITCKVKGNPAPSVYRWVFVNDAVNASTFKSDPAHTVQENDLATIQYQRPNDATFSTIFCWGINNISAPNLPNSPCTFLVTDQTVPRPPTGCSAVKSSPMDITVSCDKGHDGGLSQKFKFVVQSEDGELVSITNMEPQFIVQEPKHEEYKFVIVAYNEKGASQVVEIDKDAIVDKTAESQEKPISAVTNITTLSLALCGGVALVALAACGLVLCAHDRGSRASDPPNPPLCAYNTDESNCETCHDSDDSECNVRRTDSFRRAVSKHPSRNYDVRRSSSFHSTRYLNDMIEQEDNKKYETKHSNKCRGHSLQNISRKKDMDALCDHLVLHLPPETGYNVPKPMNTFYSMPRKMRHKSAREISDETSEITQVSDGFSLPPPPDEFSSYRAASKIKDVPKTSLYGTIRKPPKEQNKHQYGNVIISPMNTVGLPTISGAQNTLYSYPSDEHQINTLKGNPFGES